LIALALLITGLVAPIVWFRTGSSSLVRHVRGMEERAIDVIERFDGSELELRYGPTRKGEGQIRIAWALSLIGSPELLRIAFQDDPYWQPGRGVWVSATYRSSFDMRRTCLSLARRIGEPASRCPKINQKEEESSEYWIPIREEGTDGSVTVYLRRLRDATSSLEDQFSVVAEFDVKACGTLRDRGTGPCP
jgi:hypothetical protein